MGSKEVAQVKPTVQSIVQEQTPLKESSTGNGCCSRQEKSTAEFIIEVAGNTPIDETSKNSHPDQCEKSTECDLDENTDDSIEMMKNPEDVIEMTVHDKVHMKMNVKSFIKIASECPQFVESLF